MRFAKSLATAFVAALVIGAGAAEAKTVFPSAGGTVDLSRQANDDWKTKIHRVLNGSTYKGYAGAFKLTDGVRDFITFCIQPGVAIDLGKTYNVTERAAMSENIDRLYGAAYHEVKNAKTASAFQVALWEVIAETSGMFDATKGNMLIKNSSVASLANDYLSRMSTANTGKYRFTTYRNSGQDQLEASPVPLPASALLLIGGLGGMAALRRKKA